MTLAADAKLLPSSAFDYGTRTASERILNQMAHVQALAAEHGLDLEKLQAAAQASDEAQAGRWFAALHDAATLLYLQWETAQEGTNSALPLALARLTNGLTAAARWLNDRYELVDRQHLNDLRTVLAAHHRSGNFDARKIAAAIDIAAQAHTHEKAWMTSVLPTFAKQPYGRILLIKVDLEGRNSPIFVTQPFFLQRRTTLFHTHGQNWAFSRPLGPERTRNAHINTLWRPQSRSQPFPLKLLDLQNYESHQVAILPPRVIHGISKKLMPKFANPTLPALLNDASLRAEWILRTRFGERATLHLYHPCPDVSKELASSPLVQEDKHFFIVNDMIVYDHESETIWSGGGGSWPQRMIDFGTTGEQCGRCFEDDPRNENLDPTLVWDWLIDTPSPELQLYSRS